MSLNPLLDMINSLTTTCRAFKPVVPALPIFNPVAELCATLKFAHQWECIAATASSVALQNAFTSMAWADSHSVTRFAGQPGSNVTAYRQWHQQQLYEQLGNFLSVNQLGKSLTFDCIGQFQHGLQALQFASAPEPPWFIKQFIGWGQQLATALVGILQEVGRLGLPAAGSLKLVLARAKKWFQVFRRRIRTALGFILLSLPQSIHEFQTVRPTYGLLTSVQTCAPPLS